MGTMEVMHGFAGMLDYFSESAFFYFTGTIGKFHISREISQTKYIF